MAPIALADSIFPAGMGTSSGIEKHWQDGVCLLRGRKETFQATFWLQMPLGNSKPEAVPEVGCSQSRGRISLRYMHASPSGSALVQAVHNLTFLLQNLPMFPAGSPAGQGQRRVTLVTTVGADPFGVTLVTIVGANIKEGQEANSGTLPPCTRRGPPASWVSSSSTSVAPLQHAATVTWLSSPIPHGSEHWVALEVAYCSHYPGSHSIAGFTAISPQTRQASGFGG